ncbi:hypothetical protein DFH06DRAFT_1248636 [Mycena polygramma]|nr:hypothetical protein DFH06DRAFT_1248636 [Mycena polygramma]
MGRCRHQSNYTVPMHLSPTCAPSIQCATARPTRCTRRASPAAYLMSTRLAVRCLHPHHRGHRCRRCRRALVYAERALVGMLRGWGSGAATAAEPTSSDALVVAVHDLCTLTVRKGRSFPARPAHAAGRYRAKSSATHLPWSHTDSYNPTPTVTRLADCPSQCDRSVVGVGPPVCGDPRVGAHVRGRGRGAELARLLFRFQSPSCVAPTAPHPPHRPPAARPHRGVCPLHVGVGGVGGESAEGGWKSDPRPISTRFPLHRRFISSMLRALLPPHGPKNSTILHHAWICHDTAHKTARYRCRFPFSFTVTGPHSLPLHPRRRRDPRHVSAPRRRTSSPQRPCCASAPSSHRRAGGLGSEQGEGSQVPAARLGFGQTNREMVIGGSLQRLIET